MSKATRVVIDGVSYPLDDTTAVDFSEAQSLSTAEKQQARTNISAGDAADVTTIQALIGNTALPTTAQTITGAIAEHETDISDIKSAIGTVPSGSNLQGEVDDLKNGAVRFDGSQSLSAAQQTTARGNIGAGSASDVSDLRSAVQLDEKYALLLHDEIPDTTQTITFDSLGNVSTIMHTNGNNVAVRTDAFAFATNSITEVRTLNTGESLTIVMNATTLTTTVTYAA